MPDLRNSPAVGAQSSLCHEKFEDSDRSSAAKCQSVKMENVARNTRRQIEAMQKDTFLSEYLLAWAISKCAEEPEGTPSLRYLFPLYELDRIRRGISAQEVEAFDAKRELETMKDD